MVKRDTARIAAAIAVVYVAFFFGGIFVHYLTAGDAHTLKYSLSLASTWLAAVVALTAAWGLWHHYLWAWWLGLLGVGYQIVGIANRILKLSTASDLDISTIIGVGGVAFLFLAFLIVLLLSQTRTLCVK
ncbi:MAG: hypothetical protein ACRD4T_10900 [Candidatus Acidiferrales bacterium]